jgi:hypothetical protein
LLAHAYRPQLVGLSSRIFTGWLEVSADSVVYAPHTSKGFVAPPSKNLLLTLNGLLAKFGLWQARRHGTAEPRRPLHPRRQWPTADRPALGAISKARGPGIHVRWQGDGTQIR